MQQVFAHLLLVLRDRLHVDQLARHFKWMHLLCRKPVGQASDLSLLSPCETRTADRSILRAPEKLEPDRLKPVLQNSRSIVILRKEWRAGKVAGRRTAKGALLLDSAPSDSSDDSGPVLAKPPSRLGGTAFGDFGGKFCCTFRSGLRSSSEHRPGYSLLPHLYQDVPKIALRYTTRQIRFRGGQARI